MTEELPDEHRLANASQLLEVLRADVLRARGHIQAGRDRLTYEICAVIGEGKRRAARGIA